MTRGRAIALRSVKTADKAVNTVTDIIVIIILLIGLYFLVDTIWVFNHSRADVMMPFKPTEGNMAALQELSEDCIAWITLDETTIDYPIMQGEDNYEYLNKDPFGNYSLAGSLYLDSRNASDFSDDYSVIYGHHMSGGYMFGALDDFEDETYFKQHTKGTIYTQRGVFPVEALAFAYTDASNDTVFDPEQKDVDIRQWIRENAGNYNEQAEGGKLVALSTCKSPTSTRRMIVFVTIKEDGQQTEEVTLEDFQQLSDDWAEPPDEDA